MPLSKREPKKPRKEDKEKLTSLGGKKDGFKKETIAEEVKRRLAELSKGGKLGFFKKALHRRLLLQELRERKLQEWREARGIKAPT